MPVSDWSPAQRAAADQDLAVTSTMLGHFVTSMRDITARDGEDQALADIMLALSFYPADAVQALLGVALRKLSRQAPEPAAPN